MLVRLKTLIEALEDDHPYYSSTGTLYVICSGPIDFRKTDGYIQFLHLTLDNVEKTYGKQAEKWRLQMERIRAMADRLCDTNVRFSGADKKSFSDYCRNTSRLMESHLAEDIGRTSVKHPNMEKHSGSLLSFAKTHMEKGHYLGFHYDSTENTKALVMNDLMDQLSKLKMEKDARQYDISCYLCGTGYHEHIHDALNMLVQAAIYLINCRSTKDCAAYIFDTAELDRQLGYVENIIRRIETVY